MDKSLIKEILLLAIKVIKAICELCWEKIKDLVTFIRNKLFRRTGVSPREQAPEQEWGVTGEDAWPGVQETAPEEAKEPHYEITAVVPPTAKFQPGPEEKQKVEITLPPSTPELPESYGDKRIVLMMRDPYHLFTYWEFQQKVIDDVLKSLGPLARNAKLVLRVYDVTDSNFVVTSATKYSDIEVPEKAQSWYIHAEPHKSYMVDIGFLALNGTFRILSRSNLTETPRSGISEVIDKEWVSIREIYEKEHTFPDSSSEFLFQGAQKYSHQKPEEGMLSPASANTLTTRKG
ncbi:MAG: DUF4912 domain-containing protein [Candidatus Loosdrechtia sp.]|uniref:DUF4912 domain-containing protein n=1 Tax=Candidatus Loosdrechtia sp. TaxID=3101272 RepID=UPI003A71F433|nr:MAG: DUF4912 domain-containing protein [Candidatus Jettenia sp. AMX2]